MSSGHDTDDAFSCSFCSLLGCLYETPGKIASQVPSVTFSVYL